MADDSDCISTRHALYGPVVDKQVRVLALLIGPSAITTDKDTDLRDRAIFSFFRKQSGIQSGLGAAETKLLYTLHWILLDCAEECADNDFEKNVQHTNPFYYLFPVSAITVGQN